MTSERNSGYMVPIERVEGAILEIRGERVMLDADLAAIYGVTTRRLKEQVRRNRDRFPEGFLFELTPAERNEVVAKCDHLLRLKFSPSMPYAFTEHGAVMLAAVLKSKRAVEVSVFVVKAFIRMRRMLADQRQFALRLAEIESKLAAHDQSIKVVFDAIRQLMQKTEPKKVVGKIGFHVSDAMAKHEARPKPRAKKLGGWGRE